MMPDLIIKALRQRTEAMRVVGTRIRLTREHMELMQIPERFWSVTFDQIGNWPDREMFRKYLREIDSQLDRGDGLLLWGPNGHGKTSAAVIVAMEARRRGASVLFVQAEDLRVASIEGVMFSDEKTMMQRAREVDVLVIDDLGKEHSSRNSEYGERLFENLIRYRSSMRRTTVVTTNMAPVGEKHSLEKAYLRSMVDVLREATYPLMVEDRNHRDIAASEMAERLAG